MKIEMTEDEMLDYLLERCQAEGGQRKWAKKYKFSAAFISFVLSKKKPTTPRLCQALGITKHTTTTHTYFRKVD